MNLRRLSLLWKIWLSTSVALTAVFALVGFFVQRGVQDTATRSLQEEVQASSKAYQALWEARAELLESLAAVLSAMPATRRALVTRDADALAGALRLWESAPGELRSSSFLMIAGVSGESIT